MMEDDTKNAPWVFVGLTNKGRKVWKFIEQPSGNTMWQLEPRLSGHRPKGVGGYYSLEQLLRITGDSVPLGFNTGTAAKLVEKANAPEYKPLEVATAVWGSGRAIWINGARYDMRNNARVKFGEDEWSYTFPTGQTYSHSSAAGCLLMILKHAGGGKWALPPTT